MKIGAFKVFCSMYRLAMVVVVSALVSGCNTTGTDDVLAGTGTDGVFEITPNLYIVGGLGSFTDFSSSAVKVRFYKKAAKFCSEKDMVMLPISSSGRDSGYNQYASAEVTFRCAPK